MCRVTCVGERRHLQWMLVLLLLGAAACESPRAELSLATPHASQPCTGTNWPVTLELPGASTGVYLGDAGESTPEFLVSTGIGIYRIAGARPQVEPIVDTGGRTEVVYRSIDGNGAVGRTQFRAERLTAADVSADGRYVAYSVCYSSRGASDEPASTLGLPGRPASRIPVRTSRDLHEISVLDRLTNTTQRLALGRLPVWSPDGQRLAFLSEYDYATGIVEEIHPRLRLYVMEMKGGQVRELARPVASQARWSPDGRKLAFLSPEDPLQLRPGIRVLQTVDVESAVQRRLATDAVSAPAWSPDGRRVALARFANGHVAVYTVTANGTNLTRVKTLAIEDWWSGDSPPNSDDAWIFDEAWISTLAWSPDGSRLLHSCGWQICVVTVDSIRVGRSVIRPIVSDVEGVAAWLPDGSRIVVVQSSARLSRHFGEFAAYTMAPSGDDVRMLGAIWGGVNATGESPLAGPDASDCQAGVAVPDPAANVGLVRDCTTLLRIRDVLAGYEHLNWSAHRPMAEWDGVAVGGSPPRVRSLGSFSVLTGVIPPEVAGLRGLRELRLGYTDLGGTIPPELGQLTELEVLYLYQTNLSGPIPPELGQLRNLRILNLGSSLLSGGIPPELGALSRLVQLEITGQGADGRTTLGGSIPPEIGQLANLQQLVLSHSGLTGSIPPELGQLKDLRVLDLTGNRLAGSIPPELGQLANLEKLSLGGNLLTGDIPPSLTRLSNVKHLSLQGNRFSGCRPMGLELRERAHIRLPYCPTKT